MFSTLSKFVGAAALALGFATGSAVAAEANPDTLRVALLPDENAATVIKENKPLQEYLESTLGKEIELVVTTDYSSMIEAMRFGRLELAYFGPLSFTLAKSKAEIEPFAARLKDGATTYHSVLIGNKEQGITDFDKIKGQNVAFGDQASTSSHLIPKKELLDAGLHWEKDYEENFVGAHDAVAVAVQNGHAQAGGLSQPIYKSLVSRGIVSEDKVTVLKVSPAFPQYPWAMRSDLSADLKADIRQAFYDLKEPSVLKAFKVDGFAEITDADYDVVRDLATKLGLATY